MYAFQKVKYFQWTGSNLSEMQEIDASCSVNMDGTLHVNDAFPAATADMPVGQYLAETLQTGTAPGVYASLTDLLEDYAPVS